MLTEFGGVDGAPVAKMFSWSISEEVILKMGYDIFIETGQMKRNQSYKLLGEEYKHVKQMRRPKWEWACYTQGTEVRPTCFE